MRQSISLYEYTAVEVKRLPLCRRQFEMHFPEQKFPYFGLDSLWFLHDGQNWYWAGIDSWNGLTPNNDGHSTDAYTPYLNELISSVVID